MCEVLDVTEIKNRIGLYTIDVNYLKALREADTEVFYSTNYESKPFVGVIVTESGYNYFIPLTSAKPKHLHWGNVSDRHILIYEEASPSAVHENWVYKNMGNGKVKHILSVLDVKKMIPVPRGMFHRVNIKDIPNQGYRALLEREYRIVLKFQDRILESVHNTYTYQKSSGIVREFHCNFAALEKVYDKHKSVDERLVSAAERGGHTSSAPKQKSSQNYTME